MAGGLALIGIIVGVVMLVGSAGSGLPVESAQLPEDTRLLRYRGFDLAVASEAHMPQDALVPEARWSAMSHFACGGEDVFEMLLSADSSTDDQRVAEVLAQETKLHKKTLNCGKRLAERLAENVSVVDVHMRKDEDDRHPKVATLLEMGADELPKTVKFMRDKTNPDNLEQTRCLVPWVVDDPEAECLKSTRAIAKLETSSVWAHGTLEALTLFGDGYSPKAENESSSVNHMVELASSLSAFEGWQVGHPEEFRAMDPIGYSANKDLKKAREKLEKAIKNGAEAWGYGQHGVLTFGDSQLVIIPRNKEAADKIRRAFAKYADALEEPLEEQAEKDEKRRKYTGGRNEKREEYTLARRAISRRATKRAKVEGSNERLEVNYPAKPTDAEKLDIEGFLTQQKERAKHAAKVVDALTKGNAPKKKWLKEIGGEDMATAYKEAVDAMKGDWPHPPEEFTEFDGLRIHVPGNRAKTKKISDTMYTLSYKTSIPKLRRAFEKIAKKKKYKLDIDSGASGKTYRFKKHGHRISISVSKSYDPKGASLVIFAFKSSY